MRKLSLINRHIKHSRPEMYVVFHFATAPRALSVRCQFEEDFYIIVKVLADRLRDDVHINPSIKRGWGGCVDFRFNNMYEKSLKSVHQMRGRSGMNNCHEKIKFVKLKGKLFFVRGGG